MSSIDFLVCVRCFTYNHAPYIEDAMNGFCMQETTFPYVCVIVDDASTDGEPDVIKRYIQTHFDLGNKSIVRNEETDDYLMTFAQHKTNNNCFFAVYFLKYNHYSIKKDKFPYFSEFRDNVMYNAFCEGDDYWINPLKLQKQVDFLESNSDYGMCYTDFDIYYQDSKKLKHSLFTSEPPKYPTYYPSPEEFIYRAGYVCPPSWLIRRDILKSSQEITDSIDGTFVLYTYFLCTSKVFCINDVTTVYRVIAESASHSGSSEKQYCRAKNLIETKIKLIIIFDLDKKYIKLCKEKYYRDHLLFFIVYDKIEDISDAMCFLKEFSIKEHLLLWGGKNLIGKKIIRFLYKFSKKFNIQRKSYFC